MAKNQIDFSPTNPENAAMGAPQNAPEPDEETDDTLQIDVGPEPPKTAEVVTMTPEEFETLKRQSDSASAVKAGLEGLASKLQAPAPVVQTPVNAPSETPEEYFEKHADEIFDKEKGAAVLRRYNKLVAEQEYGPMLRGLSSALATTRKELLEAKDPHFKKYKVEVDALVAQQSPEVQLAPDIYERAWIAVRQKHQAEIEEETVNDRVGKAVEAKLKELGIDPTKPKADARPAAHVSGEARSTPQITTNAKRSVRLPDAATKAKLEAGAKRKGMDLEDLLRVRGYIQ